MSDDEVGPVHGVRSEETLVPATDSGEGETEFHPFDEIKDAFQLERPVMVIGLDGIPSEADRTTESDIPALSTKSLVCMGDFSSFVLRRYSTRDIIATVPTEKVERGPSGAWRTRISNLTFVSESAAAGYDETFYLRWRALEGEDWQEVEPIRPPCQDYVRQEAPFQHNGAHSAFLRLCSARRTTEGAFMSVADSGMFACSMRSPRDLESERRLDDFDQKKIAQGRERVFLPIARSDASPPAPASLGIFAPNT